MSDLMESHPTGVVAPIPRPGTSPASRPTAAVEEPIPQPAGSPSIRSFPDNRYDASESFARRLSCIQQLQRAQSRKDFRLVACTIVCIFLVGTVGGIFYFADYFGTSVTNPVQVENNYNFQRIDQLIFVDYNKTTDFSILTPSLKNGSVLFIATETNCDVKFHKPIQEDKFMIIENELRKSYNYKNVEIFKFWYLKNYTKQELNYAKSHDRNAVIIIQFKKNCDIKWDYGEPDYTPNLSIAFENTTVIPDMAGMKPYLIEELLKYTDAINTDYGTYSFCQHIKNFDDVNLVNGTKHTLYVAITKDPVRLCITNDFSASNLLKQQADQINNFTAIDSTNIKRILLNPFVDPKENEEIVNYLRNVYNWPDLFLKAIATENLKDLHKKILFGAREIYSFPRLATKRTTPTTTEVDYVNNEMYFEFLKTKKKNTSNST